MKPLGILMNMITVPASTSERSHHGDGAMAQHDLQRVVVDAQQSLKESLGDAIEPGSLLLLGRAQEARAQHGRQRHRDDA